MRFSDGHREWAQEYLGRSGQSGPFSTYGSLGQNLIGEHTIFGAVFQKGQLISYYRLTTHNTRPIDLHVL